MGKTLFPLNILVVIQMHGNFGAKRNLYFLTFLSKKRSLAIALHYTKNMISVPRMRLACCFIILILFSLTFSNDVELFLEILQCSEGAVQLKSACDISSRSRNLPIKSVPAGVKKINMLL